MKKFWYFGIAAAVIYVFAVILGGIMWPTYSHVTQAISELIMTSSPNQIVLQPLFWAYNLLVVSFSVGYYHWGKNRSKGLIWASISLFIVALSGVGTLIFPQDKIGTALSTPGLLHLIFAGLAALMTLVAMFSTAIGLWKHRNYKNIAIISLALGLVILFNGPLTAMAPTLLPNYFGISERITIGSFILWLFILSYSLFKKER